MKTRIGVIGAYTIDEVKDLINNRLYIRAGGAPIYSSLGIYVAGGEPYVFTAKGKDFEFNRPAYISSEVVQLIDKNLRFEILLSDKGRTLILKKKINRIIIPYEQINVLNGVIVNPVCREVDLNQLNEIIVPIALDLQGFIRNCEEEKEIVYQRTSIIPNQKYSVFHANYEELMGSMLTVDELFKAGFKEIIISYGQEGFVIYTKRKVYEIKNNEIGSYEIGNGDFLLGYYFTLRLKGIEIEKAIEMAHAMSVKFAIYGLDLPLLLK